MSFRLMASLALVLGGSACHKGGPEGGPRLAQVEAALDKAGWKLASLTPTDASRFSAQKCVAGTLEGLDAVVCEFGSAEAVKLGRKATESWVADALTGVALDNGRTTLGLADRKKIDANGKLIHRITQAYRAIK